MVGYRKYTIFIFCFVFLVVIAGGIVRTTQSGMGCPDWPKCFGSWIPPLTADDLPADFEKYLKKQDIDHSFNAFHTWIEYINRLLGALLGLLVLIHLVWTVRKRKVLGNVFLYHSIAMLIVVLFTAWLGKVVVDENLAVVKISLHMITALVLAFIPLMIVNLLDRNESVSGQVVPRGIYIPYLLLFILLLIQLLLGIGVRQEVDVISKASEYLNRETWLSTVGPRFIVHRSFSWIILITSIYLLIKHKGYYFRSVNKMILGLVVILMIFGIMLNYLDFPAFVQPLHLLFSLILIAMVFGVLHKVFVSSFSMKS
ncbi:MAG TPA: COX15/CtaA family protein [Saprospiraceae bacterium]|nr:COX15/CtaA family protein [Saprospiraceae bacterium]